MSSKRALVRDDFNSGGHVRAVEFGTVLQTYHSDEAAFERLFGRRLAAGRRGQCCGGGGYRALASEVVSLRQVEKSPETFAKLGRHQIIKYRIYRRIQVAHDPREV